jgi:hypothetical protein
MEEIKVIFILALCCRGKIANMKWNKDSFLSRRLHPYIGSFRTENKSDNRYHQNLLFTLSEFLLKIFKYLLDLFNLTSP